MAAPSSVKETVLEAVKSAMRSGDKERLAVLRSASAALKQREVDERCDLATDDSAAIDVLAKAVKQRRESAEQYRDAGQTARAEAEEREIEILSEFLPQAASDEEIDALIEEAINNSGAASIKDMGRVMGSLKEKLQGRADLGAVSARVKNRLGG
ncbi:MULTISPECIES: GatB/YqeY domain-containing protein [Halorhodospira]|uniref:GatB/YqeY domain-containing protein n=1 Tax=Halorhodospira TaxID=85108 RepID=UPI0019121235|nr:MULTISPECIES: GatB/YqeY domain-containing protein [Halorhodospira]MBK5935759.1 glutamyl-tRNA amidotransferase [Halorhodospira halophila]MBK5943477.1 glutamyl-tRNA amidotransferase [Halorhodospira halophila]MCG5527007.1 GatB/YqeY domain-containing protein [Halorhodospira halophila]MCG5532372.1 GatB/YqeY domain-containing protein [Halorhodospira sp. 9621]MCG5540919.1 GatB/YqeY domain-containing protein [Halorhodospira sp. M39old]